MARIALVDSNKIIVNIILLDAGAKYDTPGFTQVNVDAIKDAASGDTLDKGVLTKAIPPEPSPEEIIVQQDDNTLAILNKSLDQFDSGNADPKLVAQAVAILIRDTLRRGLEKPQ